MPQLRLDLGHKMKILIITLALLASHNIFAEETCKGFESQIEPDMQWKETDFTKERAKEAVDKIDKAVSGKISLDWYEFPNAATQIEGYLLKVKAIKDPSSYNISMFCNFVTSRPIVD